MPAIRVKKSIRDELKRMKIHSRETYNDVLLRLLDHNQELKAETKREIEKVLENTESEKSRTE